MRAAVDLVREVVLEWTGHRAWMLAAAIACYTIFSLGPLLLLIMAVAGPLFGEEAVRGHIVGQFEGLVGEEGAEALDSIIEEGRQPGPGALATLTGVAMLPFGASNAFIQLQGALNTMWQVQLRSGRGVMRHVRLRALSFSMVLGIGFLLLVSFVVGAGVAGFGDFWGELLPGAAPVGGIVNFVLAFAAVTVLLAMIYKVLPDVQIAWKDVWLGAFVTAGLLAIGRVAIGLWLGNAGVADSYGAIGAFVIILIWVFYASQIVLLGAEFTHVYANRHGSKVVPSDSAVPAGPEE